MLIVCDDPVYEAAPIVGIRAMPTWKLLAFRGLLVKYTPDELRDEQGRWTAGEVTGALNAWTGVGRDLNEWGGVVDQHAYIRAALAGDPKYAAQLPRGAALLRAVADAPRTTTPLYRGITVSGADEASMTALREGDKIALNLSSWSTDQNVANDYAYGDPKGGLPVLLGLSSGAHALDVGGATPLSWEKEWLTAGTFVVTATRTYDNGAVGVALRQTGTFATPAETVGMKGA